jgi:hypothetical protein
VEEVLETYKEGKISKKEASRAIRDLAHGSTEDALERIQEEGAAERSRDSQLVEEPIGEEPGQPLKEKAREWFQEAGGDRDLLHGMDDEAWEAYVENLDTPEEVSETYHKMQDERKMFQALWMADRMQRPQAQGPRQELARGLRELRMSRYRDLAGQAAQLRARDLVEEIFDGVTEEEQELTS